MKKILVGLLLFSCTTKEYKYEIRGKIYIPSNGPTSMHDAVWYTDTFNMDGDTLYYFNNNGNEVRIYPPFTIKNLD